MEKVKLEPFNIIGISIKTTNKNHLAEKEIKALWEEFIVKNIKKIIPNKIDEAIYSLYTDYESDHNGPYTVILGCKVKSLEKIPEGMLGKSFLGGNYAKIIAHGDLTEGMIVNEWTKIWDMDLDRKFTTDFELFGEKAQDPKNSEVAFYVAVN